MDKVSLTLMDKWILSRLNSTIRDVDDNLSTYHIPEAARAITDMVDDLSNWYVRRCRERFWGKGMDETKEAAFVTLYHVLVTLSKVIAPFVPFMAEDIYQNLVISVNPDAPESVHLCDFPVADEALIDEDLNRQMAALREVVSLGLSSRAAANLKVRQPSACLYVKGTEFDQAFRELAEDELNVKNVVFTEDARAFTTYNLKPQMRTLGPKYGKLLGKIGQHLQTMDGNEVVDAFNAGQTVTFDVEGTQVVLEAGDVLTEPTQKPGFMAQQDKGVTVVLDTNLTDALVAEGYAREVVSKVQTMRKEADFDVTDRIEVRYVCGDKLANAIEQGRDMIMNGVLAVSLNRAAAEDGWVAKDWDINGEKATLAIRK